MRRGWGWLAVVLALLACNLTEQPPTATPIAPQPPTPPIQTAWGQAAALAQSPSISPSALAADGDGFTLAAFQPIGGGVERLTLFTDGQPIQTPITARAPYALTLHTAAEGGFFAVWLDHDPARGSQLTIARLNPDGSTANGALVAAEMPVVRYSAATQPDGSLWVVWSATPIPEPALFSSRVDGRGRARTPERIQAAADHPTLLRADGQTWLYWLSEADGAAYRAELTDAQPSAAVRVADGPTLAPSDTLTSLSVGADTTHAYLFWQIMAADGGGQVWWTAGASQEGGWPPAIPLGLTTDPTESPQAGFNHGALEGAGLGTELTGWLLPASGQSDALPTAAVWSGGLGVVYWRGGLPFAAQTVVEDAPRLIAPPAVASNTERDLTLAWWDAGDPVTATLYTAISRR
ncbi:MAG: hypothetical protein MUF38_12475 [Anaerolineae bacterium]|nr:hypothetical protein [Anaerolineae bacterium]